MPPKASQPCQDRLICAHKHDSPSVSHSTPDGLASRGPDCIPPSKRPPSPICQRAIGPVPVSADRGLRWHRGRLAGRLVFFFLSLSCPRPPLWQFWVRILSGAAPRRRSHACPRPAAPPRSPAGCSIYVNLGGGHGFTKEFTAPTAVSAASVTCQACIPETGDGEAKLVRGFSDLCQGCPQVGRARVLSRSAIDRSSRYWYRVYAGSVLYVVLFLLESSHFPKFPTR